ncbi:MAG: hypothetical protein ACRDD7_05510, partial [Peptostreptococcaceae bacterium]
MQILSYLIAGMIIFVINSKLFKSKNKIIMVKNFLFFTVVLNLISLSLLRFVFNKQNILQSATYTPIFCIIVIALTVLCGLVFLGIKYLMVSGKTLNSGIKFVKLNTKSTKKETILKVVSIILFVIGMIFAFFSSWFIGYFGEITPEQFLFNLKSPIVGTGGGMMGEILGTPVLGILATSIIFIAIVNLNYEIIKGNKKIVSSKVMKKIIPIFSIIALIGGVAFASKKLSFPEIIRAYYSTSTYFEDNYV